MEEFGSFTGGAIVNLCYQLVALIKLSASFFIQKVWTPRNTKLYIEQKVYFKGEQINFLSNLGNHYSQSKSSLLHFQHLPTFGQFSFLRSVTKFSRFCTKIFISGKPCSVGKRCAEFYCVSVLTVIMG
jgi:hypothetical protein